MHVLTKLINDIRTALAFSDRVAPEQLAQYAAAYKDACQEVNRRLDQCLPHLKSGNYAEAIRIADASPAITETFQLIDFENQHEWIDICDSLGYDVPPPLKREVYQELNDAYLQYAPLEPLLRQHRLLALNGSPIRDRLAVLRSLAKADPLNLFWQTDQETFEKARIKQLGNEVTDALAKKDKARLRELYQELTVSGWCVAPPPQYRQQICTAVLSDYAAELQKHHSAFNFEKASAVYKAMSQVLSGNHMAMPPHIGQQISPAVQWIQNYAAQQQWEQLFQQNIEELEEALDNDEERPTLEQKYYTLRNSAVQIHRPIPSELESRYHSHLAHIDRIITSRNRIIFAAMAGLLIFVTAVIVFALVKTNAEKEVEAARQTLENYKSEKQIDHIKRLLPTLKPHIKKSLAALITELEAMLQQAETDKNEFERYYAQTASLLDAKPAMNGKADVQRSLDIAEGLKRTDEEIRKFTELRSRFDRYFAQLQEEKDRQFSKDLAAYQRTFDNFPRQSAGNGQLIQDLQTLAADVKDLLKQYPDISDSMKGAGSKLLKSIEKRQQDVQQQTAAARGFSKLASESVDLPSCKRNLEDFIAKFPLHPAAADIKEVLRDFDTIKDAAGTAAQFYQSYAATDGDYLKRLAAAAALKKQYDRVAETIENLDAVFPSSAALTKLAAAVPLDKNTFKETETLLKTVAAHDLYPWIDAEGNWYYLIEHPLISGGKELIKPNNKYVTTFSAVPKEYKIRDNDDPKAVDRNKDNHDLRQHQFAVNALKDLDKIKGGDQDKAAEIIGDLLIKMNAAKGLDPIFKVIMLDMVLSEYSRADPVFAEQYGRIADLIKDGDVELSTNWLDADSKAVAYQRKRMNVILTRLTGAADLKTIAAKTKTESDQFRTALMQTSPQFTFAGLLIKENGQFTCSPVPSGSGTLAVFRTGSKVSLLKIGTAANGQVQLSDTAGLLQGTPVFLTKP